MLILCWLTFSYVLHSTESVTMCVCLIFIEIHYICMILTKFCSPPFEVISFRSCFSGSLPPPCWILPMAMDLFNKKNLSKFWQWHQLKCIHCVCVWEDKEGSSAIFISRAGRSKVHNKNTVARICRNQF